MAKTKKPAAATPEQADAAPTPAPPASAPAPRGFRITSFIPKPVLFLGLLVGLLSFALDHVPAPIEPAPLQFNYTARTLAQQSLYYNGVGRVPNSTVFESAQRVLEGEALGVEDIAVSPDGKRAYAGLRDGRIVYFENVGHGKNRRLKMHDVARIGIPAATCGDEASELICGRPLGLTFARALLFPRHISRLDNPTYFYNSTVLLIVDAYSNVLLMDAKGQFTHLFERTFNFLNAIAVTAKGEVFITESSLRFNRSMAALDGLERKPTGQLLYMHPATLRPRVIAWDLPSPNGIVLMDNDQALLIAMMHQNKIVKYNIKAKTFEDFAFVPGIPDNLWIENDSLFVGLVRVQPWWYEYVLASPKLRKLISLVMTVPQLRDFASPHGAFCKVDLATGDVTHVYEDRDGSARFLSGVHAFGDHYYLTSWVRDYLVRIPKKDLA